MDLKITDQEKEVAKELLAKLNELYTMKATLNLKYKKQKG